MSIFLKMDGVGGDLVHCNNFRRSQELLCFESSEQFLCSGAKCYLIT